MVTNTMTSARKGEHLGTSITFAPPTLAPGAAVRLAAAANGLWRVLDARDRVIGHLQIVEHELGIRYRARRFHAATGRFRDLGDSGRQTMRSGACKRRDGRDCHRGPGGR